MAASLFPDQGRENRFFVEAPRKIFAHLLNLKPTPEELTYWMCHAEEIDKRVEGTEMRGDDRPPRGEPAERCFRLAEHGGGCVQAAAAGGGDEAALEHGDWAKERKGWVFLTSKPTMRERMRPLISLWLDLLVLRLMNEEVEQAQDVVRAGRAGEPAASAAAQDGGDGEQEIE